MCGWVNHYYIETGYGFDPMHSTVRQFEYFDEFGRAMNGKVVFMGTWQECIEYAENH